MRPTASTLTTPVLLLALLPALAAATPAPPGAARCAVAAQIFLDGLVPEQRKRAVAPLDGDAWRKPAFPPGSAAAKSGIRTGEMTDGQRIRLHDFLSCGLSSQGYQKLLAIMRRVDFAKEAMAALPPADRETRADIGMGFYSVTIFGEPSAEGPWAWRVEGHHLALDFNVRNGKVELSPVYMGADPAVMTKSSWAGYRVMDTEFTRGLELLESLTSVQRDRAVLGASLPAGFFTTPDRGAPPGKLQGLPAAALNDGQRRLLMRLVDEYVGNAEPGTAERLHARIAADGIEKLYFAWMGPIERGKPVYYRVQGPSLVIEFLHAPNSGVARGEPDINHIHTWWRVLDAKGNGQ